MRTAVVAPAVALLWSVASSVTVPALLAVKHVIMETHVRWWGRGRATGSRPGSQFSGCSFAEFCCRECVGPRSVAERTHIRGPSKQRRYAGIAS